MLEIIGAIFFIRLNTVRQQQKAPSRTKLIYIIVQFYQNRIFNRLVEMRDWNILMTMIQLRANDIEVKYGKLVHSL